MNDTMKPEANWHMQSNMRNERGFSLVEISIFLIVIGLILTPLLKTVQHNLQQENMRRTVGSLSASLSGLNKYYNENLSAYPCPAGLAASPDNAASGEAVSCADINTIADCTDANWFLDANQGVCRTSADPNTASLIGAVPYRTVQMNVESVIDMWGNKIIYVVPFLNTDADPAVTVQSINTLTLDATRTVVPSTTAEVFLFSTGENGRGGFTKEGVKLQDCGTLLDGHETENCDFDNVFFKNDAGDNTFSNVVGDRFLDDYTKTQDEFPTGTWFEHNLNPLPASANNRYAITQARRVGVGTNTPESSLHVDQDIRIETSPATCNTAFPSCGGRLKTPNICDETDDCFEPEKITDSLPEMRCETAALNIRHPAFAVNSDPSYAYNGVGVRCASPADSSGNPVLDRNLQIDISTAGANIQDEECDPGDVVSGFDSSGEPICATP